MGPESASSPHNRFAASGATRNETPEASRIVPAADCHPVETLPSRGHERDLLVNRAGLSQRVAIDPAPGKFLPNPSTLREPLTVEPRVPSPAGEHLEGLRLAGPSALRARADRADSADGDRRDRDGVLRTRSRPLRVARPRRRDRRGDRHPTRGRERSRAAAQRPAIGRARAPRAHRVDDSPAHPAALPRGTRHDAARSAVSRCVAVREASERTRAVVTPASRAHRL